MLKRSNPHTAEGAGDRRSIIVTCCLGVCCALVILVRGALAQDVGYTSEVPMIAAPAPQPATPVAEQPALDQPAVPQPATPVVEQPALDQPAVPQPAASVAEQPALIQPAAPQPAASVAEQPALIQPAVPQPATSVAEQPALVQPIVQPVLPSMGKPVASAATAVATPVSSVGKALAKSTDEVLPKSLFLNADEYLQISNAIADYRQSLLPPEERAKNIVPSPLSADASAPSEPNKIDKTGGTDKIDTSNQGPKTKSVSSPRRGVDIGSTFPQFFMESLVYNSPEDWVVRINGQRITPGTPAYKLDVVVVAIDRDKVMLRWRPFNMGPSAVSL